MSKRKMQNIHNFHIPIMGTGFTIDTPLRVAKFGISSVVSLVDDVLIEQVREYHCNQNKLSYEAIEKTDSDYRAKRITTYLNLLDHLIKKQVEELKILSFSEDNDLKKYFDLLPDCSELKKSYLLMLQTSDQTEKKQKQTLLRESIQAGSIDVNIMTKLNGEHYSDGEKLPAQYSDALAALRGYANSTVSSSMIFSAGLNPVLYGYMTEFDDFFPDEKGHIKKKIVLKVSDYRSAVIQGKFLAKKGLWVSEYRIESALNCGGHAFLGDGSVIGPILEEFKTRKTELINMLHDYFVKALQAKGCVVPENIPAVKVTVQGGIGTHEEHQFLIDYYQVDSVGWATPFMLVPEAVNVDEEHLEKLMHAEEKDVRLNSFSPLGISFWNLITSASELARQQRVQEGCPGATCTKGYLRFDKEFTERPICQASKAYISKKMAELDNTEMAENVKTFVKEMLLNKSCICHDLAGCVTKRYHIDPNATPAVCCGPNIVNFAKIATLQEMVDHIYGRTSLLAKNNRPHVFIRELEINTDFLEDEIEKRKAGLPTRQTEKMKEMRDNLIANVGYYQQLGEVLPKRQELKQALDRLLQRLRSIVL